MLRITFKKHERKNVDYWCVFIYNVKNDVKLLFCSESETLAKEELTKWATFFGCNEGGE